MPVFTLQFFYLISDYLYLLTCLTFIVSVSMCHGIGVEEMKGPVDGSRTASPNSSKGENWKLFKSSDKNHIVVSANNGVMVLEFDTILRKKLRPQLFFISPQQLDRPRNVVYRYCLNNLSIRVTKLLVFSTIFLVNTWYGSIVLLSICHS